MAKILNHFGIFIVVFNLLFSCGSTSEPLRVRRAVERNSGPGKQHSRAPCKFYLGRWQKVQDLFLNAVCIRSPCPYFWQYKRVSLGLMELHGNYTNASFKTSIYMFLKPFEKMKSRRIGMKGFKWKCIKEHKIISVVAGKFLGMRNSFARISSSLPGRFFSQKHEHQKMSSCFESPEISGLFLMFSSVEVNFVFSARWPVLFSLEVCSKIVLCHSSLVIMSAKNRKSELFSYFKNVKGEFLARTHAIYSNKGLLNSALLLCWCKCKHVRKNMREAIDCVLRSLYGLPGQSC